MQPDNRARLQAATESVAALVRSEMNWCQQDRVERSAAYFSALKALPPGRLCVQFAPRILPPQADLRETRGSGIPRRSGSEESEVLPPVAGMTAGASR